MNLKRFSIIEMAVVLVVILILMLVSVAFYKTVQRSIKNKNQIMEFEVIRLGINSYQAGVRATQRPSSKHVSIYDLIYVHGLISENRIMLEGGNDKSKSNAKILSYFGTPIEVYVAKLKNDYSLSEVEAKFQKIVGYEYLTGDFEFYFGNDHEVNGGEKGGVPYGTPFGLIGNGSIDDGHTYHYKFVYRESDEGPEHEFRMH